MWNLPPLKPDDVLIYLRKSRTDDPTLTVEEVLAKHEQMLDEWADKTIAGRVPEENRYREIVSGETIDSRPQIQELLRRIESPRVKAILIVEPQRLSRGDLEDIGRLVKLLRYSNTLVLTLKYSYDLRDERDRDDFERELKRGNEFLEYTKRIMNNGRVLSVENGNYIGNKPPYGYQKIQIKEGRRKCYTLEPVPEQARIVKMIFELYAEGNGVHRIAKQLNDLGVQTIGEKNWRAATITHMLKNEHYRGMVYWNKRKSVRSIEDGEVVTSRPVSTDYLIFPGKHEAIIDQDLWDKVQEIKGRIAPISGRGKHVNPFAGLLYCSCGFAMMRRTYMRNGEERTPPRLLCSNQSECGTASCMESEMLDAVRRALENAIHDFEVKIEDKVSDTVERHRQIVEQLETRYAELEKREIAQWDKYTQEGMPKHIFEQLNSKVLAEKEEVQQALCTAKGAAPKPIDYQVKRQTFQSALDALMDPEIPAKEKNLLLKECIERIEYKRERKKSGNPRWGDPEPIELEFHLKV